MTELVDKGILKLFFLKKGYQSKRYKIGEKWELNRQEIYEVIDGAPTVDAQPVRHGRWIPVRSSDAFGGDFVTWKAHGDPIAYHYCSKCKEQSRCDEFGDEILTKFCPDCGAKMDGEEE